jgi:galactose mutarotase-like enzyme
MSKATASYTTEIAGWKALVLESDLLRVTTLPGYGGWILSVVYKPRDVELLWQAPRGVIHRDDAAVVTDVLQQYKARSPGAWPEIFPHGSSAVKVNGVTIPFHGEAVLRAWQGEVLEPAGEVASARLALDCHLMPLRLERTMRVEAGRATLVLDETVTNCSPDPLDFMWGHHPIFGKPLLDEKARIYAPTERTLNGEFEPGGWPEQDGRDMSATPAEGSRIGDMFYLAELDAGWVAINNPEIKLGAALSWDLEVFPYVWIWRDAGHARDWPYFGRAYTTALEPFSSLPGARERGERLLHLGGGESLSTRLTLTAFEGLTAVGSVSVDGEVS